MRRARIRLSCAMMRDVLDLPAHLEVTGAYQTAEDQRDGVFSVSVQGPYCPEVAEGEPAPELEPVFISVEPCKARLLVLRGLDT